MTRNNYNNQNDNCVNERLNKINELTGVIEKHLEFSISQRVSKADCFVCVDVWKSHQQQLLFSVSKRPDKAAFCDELDKLIGELQSLIAQHGLNVHAIKPSIPSSSVKVQLHSNTHIDFANIQALKFNIEDIAHSLSHQCRFNGHTREFYSVAQHSVLVSYIVPPEHALAALLHDAAEAYCGDVVSPLKAILPVYQAIHNDIERTIFMQLGLEYPAPVCVRDADIVALATEVRDLMPSNPALWHNISDVEPHHETIKPWTPEAAKSCFLQRYFDLQSKNIQQAV